MTLPYRTDGKDLERFVEALARGRTLEQIQTLNFSKKGLEGTVTAAEALGFASRDHGDLTDLGRRFALAGESERKRMMLQAVRSFEPYGLLIEAVADRGETTTETEWVERWWSTHGYGSSGSNRSEGSSALARFLEYAGAGTYVQGRRGHPSRIEWSPGALSTIGISDGPDPTADHDDVHEEDGSIAARVPSRERPPPRGSKEDSVELSLPLDDGRTFFVRCPRVISSAERARLLTLLEHLLVAEDTD